MSPSPQPHEPTMEEILASIRKIISEDQAEPAPAAAAQAAPAPEPEADEPEEEETDVLELTQVVAEEPPANVHAFTPPHREPEPQPEPEPEPEVTASAAMGSEVPVADDVAFVDQGEEEVPMVSAGEDLITDNARVAMARAFAPYSKPAAAMPQMPAPEGAQLESVFMRAVMQSFDPVLRDWMTNNSEAVVQNMKPIIREWMDENLPDLVERAVKSEMAAAVRMVTKQRR